MQDQTACADLVKGWGGWGGRLGRNKEERKSPLQWLRQGSLSLANDQEAVLLILLLDFYHPGQLLPRFLIAILKARSTLLKSDFLLKGK